MYFITIRYLQHKNKLQKAIQDAFCIYQHTLTDKTFDELKKYFQDRLNKLNEEHTRCAPVKFTNWDYNISFGDETTIYFTKVNGTMEANFNVQTQM